MSGPAGQPALPDAVVPRFRRRRPHRGDGGGRVGGEGRGAGVSPTVRCALPDRGDAAGDHRRPRRPPTGDGNNTAAYVCRSTRGSTTLSAHAYGLAIDVNPFVNPYRKGDLVLPELAGAYLKRSWSRPGMILPGGVVDRAFAAVGWTWGGDFSSVSDLMHFSANGR
ncbi:MAG: M15 family metallopeptidase [Nocardioidaceae bacterium]